MTPGICHVCGQEIYYAQTITGRAITVDKTTSPQGTLLFSGEMVVEADPENPWQQEVAKHTAHAATCPRRRRRQ